MAEEMLSYSHHDVQDCLMVCRFEGHTGGTGSHGSHSGQRLTSGPSDTNFVIFGMELTR